MPAGGNLRQLTFGIDFGIKGQNELQQSNRQVDILKRNVNQSSGAMARMGAAAIAVGQKTKAAFASALTFVRKYRFQIMGAAAAIGAAIYGVTKAAGDFQFQLRRTGLVANATAKEIGVLRKEAIQLGIDTAFTAKEAAEGQELLARAGFEVGEIVETLPAVLDAAAIESLELANASKIVARTVRTMGYEADQSRRVIDVLAETSRSSQTEVAQLGEALPEVAGEASRMGIEIEELSAVLGILADKGDVGTKAGRRLRGIFNSLTAPTKQAREQIEKLGVDLWDEGELKSLTGIVNEFEVALEGMTSEERQRAMGEIFRAERMATFGKILDSGSENIAEFTAQLENSGGIAQYMAEEQLDTLRGSIKRLHGSINVAAINIGDFFVPKVAGAIDVVTGLINIFNEAPLATQKLVSGALAIGGGLAAIGGAAALLEKPLSIIGSIASWVAGIFGVSVGTLFGWALALVGIYFAAEDLWYSMEHGYEGVLPPLIDKFLDFIGIEKDFEEFWKDWKKGFSAAEDVISGTFWSIYHTAGTVTDGIYGLLTGDWEPVLEHWEGLKSSLKEISDGFWNFFGTDSEELASDINNYFDDLGWNMEINIRNIKWKIIKWWDDIEWPGLPDWEIEWEKPGIFEDIKEWWEGIEEWAEENLSFKGLFEMPDWMKGWFGSPNNGNNNQNNSVQPQSGNQDVNVKVTPSVGTGGTTINRRNNQKKVERNIEIPIEINEAENGTETGRKVREELKKAFEIIESEEGLGGASL